MTANKTQRPPHRSWVERIARFLLPTVLAAGYVHPLVVEMVNETIHDRRVPQREAAPRLSETN